jgi:hypothetical protein
VAVRWGTSRGSLPIGGWHPAGPKPAGVGDVRGARAAGRTEGGERLTGGSRPQCRAAALTDRRAPAGGGRGREEREARGAHGPARERRRWVEPR